MDEALVLFGILSPSNDASDQACRLKVSASISNLQHYVTVQQNSVLVPSHDRQNQWQPQRIDDIVGALLRPALDGAIPLDSIYRDIPHAI